MRLGFSYSQLMVDRDPDRVLQYVVGLCLFALTFVTYSDVLHHEFVNYDDMMLIVNTPKLTRPVTLFNLLSHFDATDAVKQMLAAATMKVVSRAIVMLVEVIDIYTCNSEIRLVP